MEMVEYFQRKALNAAAKLTLFVVRQSNPVTGATLPQASTATAPPPPSVV